MNDSKNTFTQLFGAGGLGAVFAYTFRRFFGLQKLTLRFVDEKVEKELAALRQCVLDLRVENASLRVELDQLKARFAE